MQWIQYNAHSGYVNNLVPFGTDVVTSVLVHMYVLRCELWPLPSRLTVPYPLAMSRLPPGTI